MPVLHSGYNSGLAVFMLFSYIPEFSFLLVLT
jgi:hypothetical protein